MAFKTFTKKPVKHEQKLQIAVAEYMALQYPDVVFLSESSGVRLNMGQAMLLKRMRSNDTHPDMFFAEPRGKYAGLFLELKQINKTPYLKDGSISKDKHIQDQLATLLKLRSKGYSAEFGIGIIHCKMIIDNYMAL